MDYERHLVSAWDMSTINPPDLGWKGNGNDGVGNGLVAATDIVEGIAGGKATEFDGTEWITVPQDSSLEFGSGGMSVSLWVKTTDANASLIEKGADNANVAGWKLVQTGGLLYWFCRDGTNTVSVTAAEIVDNEWHHCVVTRLGTSVYLYLDGILIGTNAGALGSLDNAGRAVTIANVIAHTFGLTGAIDSVRIYSAALTPLQVADLYAATRQGRK